jgi:hypothetical protein
MKKLIFLLALFSAAALGDAYMEDHHSHEGHIHQQLVDGEQLEVDAERFDRFIQGLQGAKIAVVSVQGMVCDFCARGIGKTFKKDKNVLNVDVDLSRGKVLIAYAADWKIDFDDIKKKILANGQNATGLQIVEI